MEAERNVVLAYGLMAIMNELLELDTCNFFRRWLHKLLLFRN
jgi:hypothetical protein